MPERREKRDETILAAAAIDSDRAYGAVIPPLYLSTNYSFEALGRRRAHDYSRSGNPTRDQLAQTLAELERGAGAVIVNSGMAAIDLVLTLLEPGATVIAPHDCYGGTWRLLTARALKGAIEVRFVDMNDAMAFNAALAREPALVWLETPSNPLMRISDISSLSLLAHAAGALVAVDNTFLSPLLQKPIPLGADFVVHSTTKFLNGHSDVVGGAVIAAGNEAHEHMTWWANCTGVTAAPFDCWLTLRGMRTLAVRLDRQQASAQTIAERLGRRASVARVHYPGLASHPGRMIAARQQAGSGAMLSFELADPGLAGAFLDALSAFTLAESLGGVESLIAHPASMTHASMGSEARATAGIGDGLLRMSIGLEHIDDLVGALDRAFASMPMAAREAAT